MSAVHVPPKPIGWRREGTATGAVRAEEILNWRPCPYCWGQRKIYTADRHGIPRFVDDCAWCFGTGEELR